VTRSRKYVNLIHVEDLAFTCLAALAHADSRGTYNVSDGNPRTWMDICQMVDHRWDIRSADAQATDSTGKRVLNKRMCELLQLDRVSLRHRNLDEALELIQRNSLNEAKLSR
jgi:nucleoside-diphosphate-sugar epimerase